MPSTRAKRKQNCICILTNIKMSFLDMTQDATYHMRCKRGRLFKALLMGPYWWWARWRRSLVMGSRRVAMIWFWSSGGRRTHIGWQLVRITSNYNNKWNNITTRLRFTLVKLPPLMLEYSRTVMFNSSYIQIMLLLNHYSLCLKCSIATIFRGRSNYQS